MEKHPTIEALEAYAAFKPDMEKALREVVRQAFGNKPLGLGPIDLSHIPQREAKD